LKSSGWLVQFFSNPAAAFLLLIQDKGYFVGELLDATSCVTLGLSVPFWDSDGQSDPSANDN
jgi:hypothetical protein